MKIYVIGGGDLRAKTTLPIDHLIAQDATAQPVNGVRGNALFVPTASHDSKPYFNTFRKTYTSECGMKADVALTSRGEMTMDRIQEKLDSADLIYAGGGDTALLMSVWRETGLFERIMRRAEQGVILAGLSAGGICYFEHCYSDTDILNGGTEYVIIEGFGVIPGLVCPHFNLRREDFSTAFLASPYDTALCIEDNCCVLIEDGRVARVLSAGGKAYVAHKNANTVEYDMLPDQTCDGQD